jgi:hypothetical protein
MKNIIIFLGIVAFAAMVTACQPDADPGGTKVQDMAGEWFVKYEYETGPNTYLDLTGYVKVMTYNTASDNGDSIWFDDMGHLAPSLDFSGTFKIKVAAAPGDLSFASEGSKSLTPYFDDDDNAVFVNVVVTDGKVLKGQGRSVSGVKTDSLHMEVELDASPGDIIRISGHRRTGFLEDEL